MTAWEVGQSMVSVWVVTLTLGDAKSHCHISHTHHALPSLPDSHHIVGTCYSTHAINPSHVPQSAELPSCFTDRQYPKFSQISDRSRYLIKWQTTALERHSHTDRHADSLTQCVGAGDSDKLSSDIIVHFAWTPHLWHLHVHCIKRLSGGSIIAAAVSDERICACALRHSLVGTSWHTDEHTDKAMCRLTHTQNPVSAETTDYSGKRVSHIQHIGCTRRKVYYLWINHKTDALLHNWTHNLCQCCSCLLPLHFSVIPDAVLSTALAYAISSGFPVCPKLKLGLEPAQETGVCAHSQSDQSSLEMTIMLAYSSAIYHKLENLLIVIKHYFLY